MGRRSYNTQAVPTEVFTRIAAIRKAREARDKRQDAFQVYKGTETPTQEQQSVLLACGAVDKWEARKEAAALDKVAREARDRVSAAMRVADNRVYRAREAARVNYSVDDTARNGLQDELRDLSRGLYTSHYNLRALTEAAQGPRDPAAVTQAAEASIAALTKAVMDRLLPAALELEQKYAEIKAECGHLAAEHEAATTAAAATDAALDKAHEALIESLCQMFVDTEAQMFAELKHLYCVNKTQATRLIEMAEYGRLYQSSIV